MTLVSLSELIGTAILILLGDGVVAKPSACVSFARPGPVEGGRYTQDEVDKSLYQPFCGKGFQMCRESVLVYDGELDMRIEADHAFGFLIPSSLLVK